MSNVESSKAAKTKELQQVYHTCISGSHILHYHNILDAYGHLSVRHPSRSDIFMMPRNLAPALIRSHNDLVQYYVLDASPVEVHAPRGYVERYIHSEIYRRYPNINSVVHSHSKAIIPYSITGISTPVFDVAKHYQGDDIHDLLIRNKRLGEALASHFAHSVVNEDSAQSESMQSAVLMRGHGFTVVGTRIEEAIFRAVYMQENAEIQTASLVLRAAHLSGLPGASGIRYLSREEAAGTSDMTQQVWDRAWALWIKEIETDDRYSNES